MRLHYKNPFAYEGTVDITFDQFNAFADFECDGEIENAPMDSGLIQIDDVILAADGSMTAKDMVQAFHNGRDSARYSFKFYEFTEVGDLPGGDDTHVAKIIILKDGYQIAGAYALDLAMEPEVNVDSELRVFDIGPITYNALFQERANDDDTNYMYPSAWIGGGHGFDAPYAEDKVMALTAAYKRIENYEDASFPDRNFIVTPHLLSHGEWSADLIETDCVIVGSSTNGKAVLTFCSRPTVSFEYGGRKYNVIPMYTFGQQDGGYYYLQTAAGTLYR